MKTLAALLLICIALMYPVASYANSFTDDFESGASTQWENEAGDWGSVNPGDPHAIVSTAFSSGEVAPVF